LRLKAAELSAAGVAIEARLDPILPGLTDDESFYSMPCVRDWLAAGYGTPPPAFYFSDL
jgi:DNA repair photolyase